MQEGPGQPRPFFADPSVGTTAPAPGNPDYAGQPGESGPPGDQGSFGQAPAGGPLYGQPRLGGPQYGQPGLVDRPADRPPDNAPRLPPPGGWPPPPGQRQGSPPRPARPPRQRPSKPPSRELKQRAIASLVFGAVGLIALFGLGTDLHKGVYLLAFSAAVGLAGGIIGITALVSARNASTYRPRGAIAGIVLGAFAVVVSLPILVTYLVFPTQLTNYVNCLNQAPPSSNVQHTCMTKFYKSIHLDTSLSATRLRPDRTH
jgi:hypothetical protein